MTFKDLFLCAVIAGVSTLAIACTAPTQTSQAENSKRVENSSEYVLNLPTPTIIETHNLPYVTVSTPKGPRQIYDQSKNPNLISSLEARQAFISEQRNYAEYEEIGNRIGGFMDVQEQDYLRLGCIDLINSYCGKNSFFFEYDCGQDHNFGSNRLSQCEKNSKVEIPRQSIATTTCKIHGAQVVVSEILNTNDLDEQANRLTNIQCLIWRK